ncbi:hypothetical protein ULMA_20540 [Patiriisocius marinus]|uniref:Uncharacterized protein n=1 Tax=Patiriisocius marinus TaxID=1397112 RepID=A0A5J4IYB7_9FLAO|nr:hypothetical protein [Patiriisocius marinus]GER59946.1 hypothetical protein ULMA_20540 [Patiriisocius marinus]
MKETDFIGKLGIGAFAYISISEFCGLIEYLFENVLIISGIEPLTTIWLPEIMSLLLFTTIVVWGIKKYNKLTEIDIRKTLKSLIVILFGILILQFLFTYFGTDFLMEKYSAEFEDYAKGNKGSLILRGYLAFLPILQFVILGIILLMNKKTVANNV